MDVNRKINWLIETGYDEDIGRVIDKVQSFGDNVYSDTTISYREMDVADFIHKNHGPVMTLGSVRSSVWVQKLYGTIPAAFCTLDNFKCTSYYPRFHKYLLNKKYFLLPYEDLISSRDFIACCFEKNFFQSVFIRPNSGAKLFTGEVVSFAEEPFEAFVKSLNETAMQGQLVLIAEADGYFEAEYRVFCTRDKVICGSQYRKDGEIYHNENVPDRIYKFVDKVISETNWFPDPMYAVDVVTQPYSTPKVIEINSLSASGFYAANLDILIPEIRREVFRYYDIVAEDDI